MGDDARRLRIVPRGTGRPAPVPRRFDVPAPIARRRATIVIATLDAPPAPTRASDALEHAVEHSAAELQRLGTLVVAHGGRVVERIGGTLVAAFGAPVAIERAAHRALRAAAAMRAVDGVRIGVESGVVLVGERDGAAATVTGEAIGVARRLASAAEVGHALVGERAHDEGIDAFAFAADRCTIVVDAGSIVAWTLGDRVGHTHDRSDALFVGREDELAIVRAHVVALAERGGWIDLVGDAGIGKSRLVRELVRTTGERARVFEACCSGTDHTDLQPFLAILRAWAGIGADDGDDDAMRKLFAAVMTADAATTLSDEMLVPTLAMILGVETPMRGVVPAGGAGAHVVLGTLHDVVALLASEAPTVIVIEDLHWADRASIELLAMLHGSERATPVVVVTTRRPEPETLSRQLPEPSLRLHLASLSPVDADRLLRALVGDALPAAVAARAVARTGGNPFFIEQVARGLARAADDAAVAIPETIEQLLHARVDRLSAPARRALEVAAVAGPTIERALLARLVDDDPASLHAAMDELVECGLVRASHDGWAFPHALAHEAVYAGILRARRIALHARVADAMVARASDHRPDQAGVLAYHYERAERFADAERYLVVAGEHATETAASDAALHYYQEATRLFLLRSGDRADADRQAELLGCVGRAFFQRGRLLEASDAFSRALDCLGASSPRRWGLVRLSAAALTVAADLFVPWRRRRRTATAHDRRVFDLVLHRQEAHVTADPRRLVVDCLDGLRRFAAVDPASVPQAGGFYAAAAGIAHYGGISVALARRLLDRAAAYADRDDPRERLRVDAMEYIHRVLAGDWERAREVDSESLTENFLHGRLWELTTYLGVLAEQRIHEGRWADAEATINFLAGIEGRYDFELAKSNRQAMTALLHLERGELAAALGAARSYLADHRDELLNIYALGILAKIRILAGDVDGGSTDLVRARDIVRRVGRVPPFHRSCYARSRLLLDVVRHGATADSAARARRVSRWIAWSRPEILRLAGTAAWSHGRRRHAAALWTDALAEATRLGLRPEAARICREAGRSLSDGAAGRLRVGGMDATACRQRAEALFVELGVSPGDV